jgi:hypothetical protein
VSEFLDAEALVAKLTSDTTVTLVADGVQWGGRVSAELQDCLSEIDTLRSESQELYERVARLTDDLTAVRLELLTSDALREGLVQGLADTYACEAALRLRLQKQEPLVAAAKALHEYLQADEIDAGRALVLREELHQATADYLEQEPS